MENNKNVLTRKEALDMIKSKKSTVSGFSDGDLDRIKREADASAFMFGLFMIFTWAALFALLYAEWLTVILFIIAVICLWKSESEENKIWLS